MISHTAAFGHVFTGKIAASENGAFTDAVKRRDTGEYVLGGVLSVAVYGYDSLHIGEIF